MKTSLNWILGVFLAPFLTLAQEDSLSVVRAAYGAGTTQRDVTQLLQAQVRGNQLTIEVGNHTLGGDPIFGKPKTLYVRYRKSGSEFAVSAAEGETLRIPAANAKAIALVQETRPQPPANQQPPSVQTVQPGTPLGEITTLSGKKYLNATLTRIEPNGISITHDDGLAKVSFADLSEELRKKYGYDPTKAAQFSQTEQTAAAQRAAAANAAANAQRKATAQENAPKYRVFMRVGRKTEGGLLLERFRSGEDALEAHFKNEEAYQKTFAYWDAIPENQRLDAAEESHGRFFLRGYPRQETLVDEDAVICLSVADGSISIGGSTYRAFRWVPIPRPK